MASTHPLRLLWEEHCEKLHVDKVASSSWWTVIYTKYSEPQRFYHTLQHLTELFEYHQQYYSKLKAPYDVAMAIWFHDIIYDPTKGDNELRSVDEWQRFAAEAHLNSNAAHKVSLYIDLTKTHKIPEEYSADTDLAYFLDFDLAILGKPQVAYDTYATQIRQEYIHVPDDKFKIGRPAVLKQLMEGELYFTEEFITNLDERARANIRREIETLSS